MLLKRWGRRADDTKVRPRRLLMVAACTVGRAQDCKALQHLLVHGYALESLKANEAKTGPGTWGEAVLPAHCLLHGEIDSHVGVVPVATKSYWCERSAGALIPMQDECVQSFLNSAAVVARPNSQP